MEKRFKHEIYYKVDNSKLNIYVNEDKSKSIVINEDRILQFENGTFKMYNKRGILKYEV